MMELLVSISIFGLITSFAIASFKSAGRSDELRIATQYVVGEMRRAQTMTIGGKAMLVCISGENTGHFCPSGTNSECGGTAGVCRNTVPNGGYGVQIGPAVGDGVKMNLFADANADGIMQDDELVRSSNVSPGARVTVTAVTPKTVVNGRDQLSVTFLPPDARGRLNGVVTNLVADIQLTHPELERPRHVTVNAMSGQISTD